MGHLSIYSLHCPTFNPQGKNGEHLSQDFQRSRRSMEIFQVFLSKISMNFFFPAFAYFAYNFEVRKVIARVLFCNVLSSSSLFFSVANIENLNTEMFSRKH